MSPETKHSAPHLTAWSALSGARRPTCRLCGLPFVPCLRKNSPSVRSRRKAASKRRLRGPRPRKPTASAPRCEEGSTDRPTHRCNGSCKSSSIRSDGWTLVRARCTRTLQAPRAVTTTMGHRPSKCNAHASRHSGRRPRLRRRGGLRMHGETGRARCRLPSSPARRVSARPVTRAAAARARVFGVRGIGGELRGGRPLALRRQRQLVALQRARNAHGAAPHMCVRAPHRRARRVRSSGVHRHAAVWTSQQTVCAVT